MKHVLKRQGEIPNIAGRQGEPMLCGCGQNDRIGDVQAMTLPQQHGSPRLAFSPGSTSIMMLELRKSIRDG
jgi:hypothetical protein